MTDPRHAEHGDEKSRAEDPHGTDTHPDHRSNEPTGTPTSDRHETETSHQAEQGSGKK